MRGNLAVGLEAVLKYVKKMLKIEKVDLTGNPEFFERVVEKELLQKGYSSDRLYLEEIRGIL